MLLLLPPVLDGQLQHDSGITMFDYLVLSALSMSEDQQLHMTELAALANGSMSRLSNVVKRLEKQGLMAREPDPADGRFTFAQLTPAGLSLVKAAAPGHVAAVRRYVIGPLTKDELRSLSTIGTRIRQGIGRQHGKSGLFR